MNCKLSKNSEESRAPFSWVAEKLLGGTALEWGREGWMHLLELGSYHRGCLGAKLIKTSVCDWQVAGL